MMNMNAMPMMGNMMGGNMMNGGMMPMMGNMMNPAMMNGSMMQQPMMMPMMMPTMMMNMTCEMMGDAMVCKMTPMGGMSMEMMKECCDSMNRMMKMGMPMMMCCGNMMMCCTPAEMGGKAMGAASRKK